MNRAPLSVLRRRRLAVGGGTRPLATVAPTARRAAKREGTIADVFSSLTNQPIITELPDRFAVLKKEILASTSAEALTESWRQVLAELEGAVANIVEKGEKIIPRVAYSNVEKGLSESQKSAIRETGVVVVTGGVPKEEALAWKQALKDYIKANPVKGFPEDNIQVYELYNTSPQIVARTHTALLRTQKALLELWHSSEPTPVDLHTPISYFDRLRIRLPGDATFALGPHIDGGSLEMWEDETYRRVYGKILEGGSSWREHDPFDMRWRLEANQDLYNAPNQCSIFRAWQGWTSLSTTSANEGTLRVLPMLSLSSAYILLRPFFRPRNTAAPGMAFEDWVLDVESSTFPGSVMSKTQELNESSHPHLRLDKTMLSIPSIEPGDQVYWHCDTVHAVEAVHRGAGDSSVMYIPAVPLTLKNAIYLRDQRSNFMNGLPAPDFPGGEGESKFRGRGTPQDITTREGRQALGFEPIMIPKSSDPLTAHLINEANKVLFG